MEIVKRRTERNTNSNACGQAELTEVCIMYPVLLKLQLSERRVLSQATDGQEELLPLLVLGADLITNGNVTHHIDGLEAG